MEPTRITAIINPASANGTHTGGGMNLTPNARFDDGRLDVLIINTTSVASRLLNLPKIYSANHVKLPRFIYKQGKTVRIDSAEPVLLEADGEMLGHAPGRDIGGSKRNSAIRSVKRGIKMTDKEESFQEKVLRLEFEYRIFVSFGIVTAVAILSLNTFSYLPSPRGAFCSLLGIGGGSAQLAAYLIAALFMLAASILRTWAGSTLSSHRTMAFQVQTDTLLTDPPYTLCRNPTYLADFTTFCGFAVIMPLSAVSLPFLLLVRYGRLIAYEQTELRQKYLEQFSAYERSTPAFFPTLTSILTTIRTGRGIWFNKDGTRHNALYLLFIPGFIVAFSTHNFFHALAIGLPTVFDWESFTQSSAPPTTKHSQTRRNDMNPFNRQGVFDDILYSHCWEDPAMDIEVFRIRSTDLIFSITSGGRNVLAFLADNPKRIISPDVNLFQNYLLDFKMNAFRRKRRGIQP